MKQHGISLKHNTPRVLRVLIYIYVCLLPIGTGLSGIIGDISLLNYIAGCVLLVGVAASIRKHKAFYSCKAIPCTLYFLYTITSFLWSTNRTLNWYVFTNAVNAALFITLNCFNWKKETVTGVEKAIETSQIIVLLAVVMNFSSVYQYRLHIKIVSSMGISDFACGLCLIIAFWIHTISRNRSLLYRIFGIIFLFFDALIIVFAGSRGALLMIVAMFVMWVILGNMKINTKVLAILFAIAFFYFYNSYMIDFLPSSISGRLTLKAIQDSNGSGRFNVWLLATQRFVNSNPFRMVFGYGFNSFKDVVNYESFGGHIDLMAHNVVFQTMIEGGILGLFFLGYMMFSQIKIALAFHDDFMIIALVGLFVSALSIDMQVTRIWGFVFCFNYMRYSAFLNNSSKKKTWNDRR